LQIYLGVDSGAIEMHANVTSHVSRI